MGGFPSFLEETLMQHLTDEQRKKLAQAQELCESVLMESGAVYGENEISSPPAAAISLRALIGLEQREVFAVLFLDNQNRLLKSEKLFYGTINQTNVYVREIIKTALYCNAAAMIVSHNHPSGEVMPSQADKLITRKIKEACELMEIRMLDHIIIGHNKYYSFESECDLLF